MSLTDFSNITFRASFQDLQVGDTFFILHTGGLYGRWSRHTITRLTPKFFIHGFGNIQPNGRPEYENQYRRSDGTRIGDAFAARHETAYLPTPELVARLQREAETAAVVSATKTLFQRLDAGAIRLNGVEQRRAILRFFREQGLLGDDPSDPVLAVALLMSPEAPAPVADVTL